MKKILVIEDEAPLAEALKYTLEKEGYEVEVAGDGALGLRGFKPAALTSSCWTLCSLPSTGWRSVRGSGPPLSCPF